MKHIILGVLFLAFYSAINAQQLSATYDINRTVVSRIAGNNNSTVADLKLIGYYYLKGNKVISFSKPLYLNDFPTGSIVEKENDFMYHTHSLIMDTIQGISYFNLDSMIFRTRMQFSGLNQEGVNYVSSFSNGVNKWEVFPETRQINNLVCQRAILKKRDKIVCDVWFAKDIQVPITFYGFADLPGLLVEGEMMRTQEKFSLKSYTFDKSIPDSIFWPAEFNEPFKKM